MKAVVVIPAFNRGYVLARTIQSVIDQTHTDWTCFVLDDGSTDNTFNVATVFRDKDPRVIYHRFDQNRGGVAMNEVGMALARDHGDFWVRLGSDDYFFPHKLALDNAAMEAGVDACWGPYRDLYYDVEIRDRRGLPMDARHALLSGGFSASWANIAVRSPVLAKLYERHGRVCDPRIKNMEDWLVNTRIAYDHEFAWRGLTNQGELVIHARSFDDVFVGATEEDLVYDAVWRVADDGASQKPDVCAADAKITVEVLAEDLKSFRPAPESRPEVIRRKW